MIMRVEDIAEVALDLPSEARDLLADRLVESLDAQLTTTLPGTPEGEYVVIQFKTNYANKPDSVETITPMLADVSWRVSGYFIK